MKRLDTGWRYWDKIWFFLCFLAVCLFTALHIDCLVDGDMAGAMELAHFLSKEGAIISENWYYPTELKFLYPHLVYIPLFYLFEDWHVIRVVGSILLLLIYMGSYFYLCQELRLRDKFYLSMSFLLFPLSEIYFKFVIWYESGGYIIYISSAFVMMAMILHFSSMSRETERWKKNTMIVLMGILALAMGINGPRLILVFFLPMTVVGVCKMKDGTYIARLRAKTCIYICGCAGIGYVINSKILSAKYHFSTYDNIAFNSVNFDNIQETFNQILASIGYQQGEIGGIQLLSNSICLITLLLMGANYADVIRHKERYSENEKFLLGYVAAAFIIYVMFYAVTDMHQTERYNLPIIIFGVPMLSAFFGKIKNTWKYANLLIVLYIMLIIVRGGGKLFEPFENRCHQKREGRNGISYRGRIVAGVWDTLGFQNLYRIIGWSNRNVDIAQK